MAEESERPAISELVARVINGAVALVKAEINDYKAAVKRKAVESAVAIALFAVTGLLALILIVFLFVAAYQALRLAFAGWLAALIIAGALVVICAVLILIARRLLSHTTVPPITQPVARTKDLLTEGIAEAKAKHAAAQEQASATQGDSPS